MKLLIILLLLSLPVFGYIDATQPPYLAKGDGITDDAPAIQSAINAAAAKRTGVFLPSGTYFLSGSLKPVGGSIFVLVGENSSTTHLRGADGVVAILTEMRLDGPDYRVRGAHISNLQIAGSYDAKSGKYSGFRAGISLRGVPDDPQAWCIIENCIIRDTQRAVLWVEGFRGRTIIRENSTFRGRSINVVDCDQVMVTGNHIINNMDNALAVSRGCRQVVISGNIIRESGINGIFAGAIDLNNRRESATLRLSGQSWDAGASLVLTLQPADDRVFGRSDADNIYTLRSGTISATVQVTSLESSTKATVTALSPVPQALRDTAIATWSQGPYTAPDSVVITGNIISGSHRAGVRLTYGPKRTVISDNVIERSGIRAYLPAKGEPGAVVSLVAGRPQATFTTPSTLPLKSGQIIHLRPRMTGQEPFTARVSRVGPEGITLDRPAPDTCTQADVYAVEVTEDGSLFAGDGIVITGWFLAPDRMGYAQDLLISGNLVSGFTRGGINVGSSTGTFRRLNINGNTVDSGDAFGLQKNPIGIFTSAAGRSAEMPAGNVLVGHNMVSLPASRSDARGIWVRLDSASSRRPVLDGNLVSGPSEKLAVIVNTTDDRSSNLAEPTLDE